MIHDFLFFADSSRFFGDAFIVIAGEAHHLLRHLALNLEVLISVIFAEELGAFFLIQTYLYSNIDIFDH